MEELEILIDELVSKAGPNAGQIKVNQDSDKVARLLELGWKEPIKEMIEATELTKLQIKQRLEMLEGTVAEAVKLLADHEKRITSCSIRR